MTTGRPGGCPGSAAGRNQGRGAAARDDLAFPRSEVATAARQAKTVVVAEMNYSGQVAAEVQKVLGPGSDLRQVNKYNGQVITPRGDPAGFAGRGGEQMPTATGMKYLKQDSLPLMWCSGCGNGIVLGALLRAFEELGYRHNEIVVVTGIGCWGKADDYLATNALHTTHGRALAFATGIKAVKPALHVVVLMGDGDGVTIGGNHFIHSARRNIDLTAIIVNNYNYGMTGGQFSATTPAESITSTTRYGNPERDFDVCALAEAAGANYVARETVANGLALKNRIKEALGEKGFLPGGGCQPLHHPLWPQQQHEKAPGHVPVAEGERGPAA